MKVVHALRAGLHEWRWSLARQPRRRPWRAAWCMAGAVLERYMHPVPVPRPVSSGSGAATAERPTGAEPEVSIIIPVFNQPGLTRDCLQSITQAGAACAFEVIVVDDASTDPRMQDVRAAAGVEWLRSDCNRGFIASCNLGAARARGKLLVFLNNDTLVTAGWLDRLLETLQTDDVGLVGACLRYPDGRLQEAGGLVFSDGAAWNYGRLGHPDDPRFRHRRDVDYCSGAAIAIARRLFERLGGFAERYAPAYYEDTDLAMAVRAGGLRVVYEPAAVVVHLEGASAGTDVSSGMKAHQPINRERFLAKWGESLAARHAPPGTDPDVVVCRGHPRLTLVCAGNSADSGKVLEWLLERADRGGRIDLHLLIAWDHAALARLRAAGVCVWTHDWLAGARWHWWRTAAGLLLDDGSGAGRAWARRLARDAAPERYDAWRADLHP